MKSQRRNALQVALVSCLVFTLVSFIAPGLIQAQQEQKAEAPKPVQTPTPAPPQQGTEVGEGAVVVNTDLITLTVTVTDTYGRYVSGLDKKAFKVFEDKEEQEIEYFSDDDAPVSVGVG